MSFPLSLSLSLSLKHTFFHIHSLPSLTDTHTDTHTYKHTHTHTHTHWHTHIRTHAFVYKPRPVLSFGVFYIQKQASLMLVLFHICNWHSTTDHTIKKTNRNNRIVKVTTVTDNIRKNKDTSLSSGEKKKKKKSNK